MNDRLNEYRIMWLLVFFDLPTDTKKDRKAYADYSGINVPLVTV